MKVALISTVFNEGEGIFAWADSLRQQTRKPDEFVIVDGGSTDGTPERLKRAFSDGNFPTPKIIVEKCNIAGGRNLAINECLAEIIAVTDAGSFPEPDWLAEIIEPLLADSSVYFTGGINLCTPVNEFHHYLLQFEGREQSGSSQGDLHPSSRNTAFRRKAWADIGGYPEWLTLAAEDSLFTHQLNRLKYKSVYNPKAVVRWTTRENESAYLKLIYRNAYGGAEAQLYWPYFRQRILISLFPPLLLLSRHRFRHFRFRYLKNFASARGWLAGKLFGKRPPTGWRSIDGVLFSPEAQNKISTNR